MERRLKLRRGPSAAVISAVLLAGAAFLPMSSPALAQATDAQIRALQDQINRLQRAIDELKASQAQSAAQAKAAEDRAAQAEVKASQAQSTVAAQTPPRPAVTAAGTPYPAEGSPPGIHFNVAGQDFQFYGRPHVSVIGYNQGNKGGVEIESNQSVFGFRTARQIWAAPGDLTFIAQAEGEIAIANSPTLKNTVGYRDTFVGFRSSEWGTIALGKHNTPYKNALLAIDPFTNTLGDARALFGNTGGDNRVEFSLRAPHAAWYISPPLHTGFGTLQGSVLFSPGQNASSVNQDFAFGENICAGATPGPAGPFSSGTGQPGSGGSGSGRGDCNDGGFGNLASAEVHWTDNGWLLSTAFEYHDGVNRLGDESGVPGVAPFPGSVGVHNEYGIQVIAGRDWGNGWKTYVGFDALNRTGAAAAFNERTKKDFLATASWMVAPKDKLAASYVHATNTPGDPAFFPSNNNHADHWALGWFHYLLPQLQIFSVAAMTVNGQTAHYDVGAGGVAQPILSRKADNEVFTGKTLYGVQLGVDYSF
jgi:predicted porin/outer membrane murein-binding lipoprotein Lpp